MHSGTKSFLVMFSQNLGAELRSKGIAVQALCPGMTHTEFHQVAGIDKSVVPKPFWMTARPFSASPCAVSGTASSASPAGRTRPSPF